MAQENSNDDFRTTPIWRDVKSTILSGPKIVNFDSEIKIHTAKNDINVMKVIEFQEKCDYTVDICATVHIQFYMGLGDYTYKLYPFRDMLEVTVKKIPQSDNAGDDLGIDSPTVRYRAILNMDKNPALTGTRMPNLDYETLQSSNDLVTVTLELMDRNLEVLRVATVPGKSYRGVTPKQLISGLMVGQSQKYKVNGAPAIEAYDFVEPDNTVPMGDILVPSGLKVSNVPTFVQETLSGVYNTGVGTFYERYRGKPSWFVYPLYNTNRFEDDVDRVVIFAVPQDMLSGLDRTYRKAGRVLYIAATGQTNYRDDSQVGDLNEGVGFRQADAGGIISKPVKLTEKGPVADRARLNREVGNRERADGVYYAPTVAPSSNPFKNYSRVAARSVARINVVWENSRSDLIHPGMPVKYVFMDGGEYREITGTVLGKYTVEALIGAAATSTSYRSSTHLGLAVSYYGETPTQPVLNSPGRF